MAWLVDLIMLGHNVWEAGGADDIKTATINLQRMKKAISRFAKRT
jgi:hypothetical protein